jgi:hypothetical protein
MRKVIFGGATTLDGDFARLDVSVDWLMWSDGTARILIHPVLIGSGVPALPPMARQIGLELVSCEPFKNGRVNVVYKVGATR